MDFINEYPKACVVCLDLKKTSIEQNWIKNHVKLAIGTFLKMKRREDIEELVRKYEHKGFKIFALGETSSSDICSDELEQKIVSNLGMFDLNPDEYRPHSFLMPDPTGKTSMIRFIFLFQKTNQVKGINGIFKRLFGM